MRAEEKRNSRDGFFARASSEPKPRSHDPILEVRCSSRRGFPRVEVSGRDRGTFFALFCLAWAAHAGRTPALAGDYHRGRRVVRPGCGCVSRECRVALYAAHRSRDFRTRASLDLVMDHCDAGIGRTRVRYWADLLGASSGRQRHSPGEGRICPALRRDHTERHRWQIRSLRDSAWCRSVAWCGRPDGAHLLGGEQLFVTRGAAESAESETDDFSGNGRGHRRRI